MIARAVARRPASAVRRGDERARQQSQAIVSTSLGNLNGTRIIIAHRLSTVRQADRIIVLVDGKACRPELCRAQQHAGMFASSRSGSSLVLSIYDLKLNRFAAAAKH